MLSLPMTTDERLDRIEEMLRTLVEQRTVRDWYTVAEVSKILGKAEFTVREWLRLGRARSERRMSGRGNSLEYRISHEELTRLQNEGLLPDPNVIRRRTRRML